MAATPSVDRPTKVRRRPIERLQLDLRDVSGLLATDRQVVELDEGHRPLKPHHHADVRAPASWRAGPLKPVSGLQARLKRCHPRWPLGQYAAGFGLLVLGSGEQWNSEPT